MMQFRSAVRSLVGKTFANSTRNCSISCCYVNKYLFSSLSKFEHVTMLVLPSRKISTSGQEYSTKQMSPKKAPTSSVSAAAGREGQGDHSDSDSAVQSKGEGRQGSNRNGKLGLFRWTAEMDTRLTEGVAQYRAQSWARVAKFMGEGLSSEQCKGRWNKYLEPLKKGLKPGNWQSDEVQHLQELVPQHLIPSRWSTRMKAMTKQRTDWKAIGRELGRSARDCNTKYQLIQHNEMEKGRFTAEEDALIRQRVEEWGDKGIGLWVALEKEMGRAGKHINKRWRQTLSKKK